MNLLLDTHAVLWAFAGGAQLAPAARDAIVNADNVVFVSAVSAWEIAVKRALGKLRAPDDFAEQVTAHRFTPLEISIEHALAVERLPDHHRDPFDRLLVAQAREEALVVVTRDEHIPRYPVDVMTA